MTRNRFIGEKSYSLESSRTEVPARYLRASSLPRDFKRWCEYTVFCCSKAERRDKACSSVMDSPRTRSAMSSTRSSVNQPYSPRLTTHSATFSSVFNGTGLTAHSRWNVCGSSWSCGMAIGRGRASNRRSAFPSIRRTSDAERSSSVERFGPPYLRPDRRPLWGSRFRRDESLMVGLHRRHSMKPPP